MNLASTQAAEKNLLLNTYERNPVLFVSGKGVYLRDENGHDYLDLLSGIGLNPSLLLLGVMHRAIRIGADLADFAFVHAICNDGLCHVLA